MVCHRYSPKRLILGDFLNKKMDISKMKLLLFLPKTLIILHGVTFFSKRNKYSVKNMTQKSYLRKTPVHPYPSPIFVLRVVCRELEKA